MICAECIRLLLVVDYWSKQNEQTRAASHPMSAALPDSAEALSRLREARTQLENHQRAHSAIMPAPRDSSPVSAAVCDPDAGPIAGETAGRPRSSAAPCR